MGYKRKIWRNNGNVVLTGFMGSGKSTVGIRLSYRLRRVILDTDKIIEKEQGKTISDIFAQDSEEGFRQLETQLLKRLKEKERNKIIATGGGIPLREENRRLLKEIGTVIYLRAKPETIYARLAHDKSRPLIAGENPQEKIRTLLAERSEKYEEGADLIVDVDGKSFQQIVDEIEQRLYSVRKRAGSETEKFAAKKGKSRDINQKERENNTDVQTEEKKAEERAKTRPEKLLVINGPNLNFLGIREKSVYGTQDYNYLVNLIREKARKEHCEIEVWQSNHEGAIIDRIQEAYFDGTEGIIINPGAYTHYSYAIRDALASITVGKVEVHISNIHEREEFRKTSVTAEVCDLQIYGEGLDGYLHAVDFLLKKEKNS